MTPPLSHWVLLVLGLAGYVYMFRATAPRPPDFPIPTALELFKQVRARKSLSPADRKRLWGDVRAFLGYGACVCFFNFPPILFVILMPLGFVHG